MAIFLPGDVIPVMSEESTGCTSGCRKDRETGAIYSVTAGLQTRVDKMIGVQPLKSRYRGQPGELVVGRIVSVESSRWKVDINGAYTATLGITSVDVPWRGTRIVSDEDELNMRILYDTSDLVCAQIDKADIDRDKGIGKISLKTSIGGSNHAGSLNKLSAFGKLENGVMISVPASLIRRTKSHFVTFNFDESRDGTQPKQVDVIFGCNGNIWITRTIPISWWPSEEEMEEMVKRDCSSMNVEGEGSAASASGAVEKKDIDKLKESYMRKKHATTALTAEERERICRIRNSIYILAQLQCIISKASVESVYRKSISLNITAANMLLSSNIILIGNALSLSSLGEER